jgi:bifunctional enzyme CysN/CysC
MRQDSVSTFVRADDAPWAGNYTEPPATLRHSSAALNGIIRLLTCGSVDDGKSTLIGRLLWDASPLYDDQREKLLKETASLHGGRRPDFSRLVDGLVAEQEQGITIDIAWRYFETERRRFVIIDSPGHEQYTRNMATGASHADVAVLLVDAQSGVKRQTRRHLAILDLAGVRKVVLAINKMDLADWSQERFDAIVEDFKTYVGRFPAISWTAIPVSALNGDNVASPSHSMAWYEGPTFVEYLETAHGRDDNLDEPFRMPVQMVLRDGDGFRGVAGTVTAGEIRVGDAIYDALSGRSSRVSQIRTMDGALSSARSGQAVVLQLADHIDVSRGSLLAADASLRAARSLGVRLVWLSNDAYSPTRGYLLRTATDLVAVVSLKIEGRLDLDTLELAEANACEPNGIAEAHIDLARPVAVDLFSDHASTGAFMLVDAVSGAAVAGGVINAVSAGSSAHDAAAFTLTDEMLWSGLCADLRDTEEGVAEFRRRANEVAIILRAAGVSVGLDA